MPGVGKHEQSGIAQVLFEDEGVDWINDDVVGESILRLEPRRLGTAPFARSGRSIGEFSLASNGSWIHLQNGVWLPWQPGCTIRP